MKIAAFDLSLTATGWAHSSGVSGVIKPSHLAGMERVRFIREVVLDVVEGTQSGVAADVVAIEGLAFGAKGNAMLDLAGLAWVIRVALVDRGHTYVDIPPASMKLFATGKGNASKEEVYGAAIRKLGYAGADNNEADALWLLELAKRHYVDDFRKQTVAEGRALEGVVWPKVGYSV